MFTSRYIGIRPWANCQTTYGFYRLGICSILIMWIISTTVGLQCPPCVKIHCRPKHASKLKCRGGVTTKVCNCCPTCAKVEGQECGGIHNYRGKCDKGLTCQVTVIKTGQYSKSYLDRYSGVKRLTGICKPFTVPNQVEDEAVRQYCRPKCTPEFCRGHPKAACSAVDVGERHRECQRGCQHTSCGACRFVQDEPDCLRCNKDDFNCIRKFGKCMRKRECSKKKFPCRRQKIKARGKFQCVIPGCFF